jgi:acetyl-CoA acetyltransferase
VTVAIIGAAESPYTRHPAAAQRTPDVLADAVHRALDDAGLRPSDIDGLGVCSFTLAPDHAVDLAWRLGLRLTWLMQDTNGGASAGSMVQHATRALEAGDATNILLLAGDRMDGPAFTSLVSSYNRATEEHLSPLPMLGPNALFAMLTGRQMEEHGLVAEDYGSLVITQRRWAGLNPGAVYRSPLTMAQYLDAPVVASPLRRYDCVPPVTGADAVVLSSEPRPGAPAAHIRAVAARYNVDDQTGDGLETGLSQAAPDLWQAAGVGPSDVGVASVYDDYPSMAIAQLIDTGLLDRGDVAGSLRRLLTGDTVAINTSGGQLSAGQAGSAGGMHGLVEVVRQLRGRAGDRQVQARFGLVTGYGMVLYRYGACANAVVLEAAA